ncbi:hypothetical protein [Xanthomonas arboricola]|uniref:hypothetical protein n=1 Tax=Xanthomonas arboricola TaxID=56448 RepID=UPI000F8E4E20|nr:hypothetical protein [Xanthomonas arboricola]
MIFLKSRYKRFGRKILFTVLCIPLSIFCSEASAAPYIAMGNMVARLNTECGAEGLYQADLPRAEQDTGREISFQLSKGAMNDILINDGHAGRFPARIV